VKDNPHKERNKTNKNKGEISTSRTEKRDPRMQLQKRKKYTERSKGSEERRSKLFPKNGKSWKHKSKRGKRLTSEGADRLKSN